MINEIYPNQFNNQFFKIKDVREDDYIFHFNENSLLLLTNGDEYNIPRKKDLATFSESIERSFLFTLDDISCFLVWDLPKPEGNQFVYQEISFFRTIKQKEVAWVSIISFQLWDWYKKNKYCGKCGSKTKEKTDERAIICPVCDATVYPKISPAIIVAIISNDKILLAQNINFRNNWYSLIAGYVDVGESLEETVVREVKEEIGIDVKNIRYYKSQPWPFSGSLMIGFFAEADENQKIIPDNKEITNAAWFTRGSLPNHPPNISISGEMIEKFETGEV